MTKGSKIEEAAAAAIAGAALARSVAGLAAPDADAGPPRRPADRGESPTELTAATWKAVAKAVAADVKAHNVSLLAGGVAFYALLALVPAIVAVVSIYGLVADPADISGQLEDATAALPADVGQVLVTQVEQVVSRPRSGLGATAALGIVLALWSASAGMRSLLGALGLAYDQPDGRGFVKLRATALALTAAAVIGLVCNFALVTQAAAIAERWGLGTAGRLAIEVLRWPLLGLLAVVGIGALYRFGPDRRPAAWRWVTPGSVLASLLALAASVGLSIYTSMVDVADGAGPLGAIAVVMLWLMATAFAVLVGAELNAQLERHTTADTTVGEARPSGQRGAVVADELPPAA